MVVFGIGHSEIPDRPLGRFETRQVDVGNPSINYPNCKMDPRMNHEHRQNLDKYKYDLEAEKLKPPHEAKKVEKPIPQPYVTYYVTKRLTTQPNAKPSAKPGPSRGVFKRYQFIATRQPLDENKHKTARPNEFASQIGSIYCEDSKAINLKVVFESAVKCGIEQYLVGLCFMDEEVNQSHGGMISMESYLLDMDQVFSHYGKGEINDISNVRAQVESHCDNVIEVHMESHGTGTRARPSAKKLWAIMKGARYQRYYNL